MPNETIPYNALSYAELRQVYRTLARERGLAGNCGNPPRVKLVERIALLRTRPKIAKPLKVAKPKGRAKARALTIQDSAVRFLCEIVEYRKSVNGKLQTVGHSYQAVLKLIRAKHRNSKTTVEALRGIASKIRDGALPGALPDIRLDKEENP